MARNLMYECSATNVYGKIREPDERETYSQDQNRCMYISSRVNRCPNDSSSFCTDQTNQLSDRLFSAGSQHPNVRYYLSDNCRLMVAACRRPRRCLCSQSLLPHRPASSLLCCRGRFVSPASAAASQWTRQRCRPK